jgi:hypothetical protein
MSLFDDAKLILTPNGYKAGTAYSLKPFDGTGDFGVVRSTTATRVNSAGLIESVAANVPRINYPIGVGCPHWLVEPQRTNLLLRSEEFDNASWTKSVGITVTANTTPSPDGTSSADTIESDGTISSINVRQNATVALANVYTSSLFVKKGTNTSVTLRLISGTKDGRIIVDLSTLSVLTQGDVFNPFLNDYGGGWYRIGFSILTDATSLLTIFIPQSTNVPATAGTQIFWGAQLEAGSTASSYIPTVATAITRNADVITVAPPAGTTEIVEYFADNTTNTITVIPVTYQLPNAEIEKVIMT